VIWSAAEDRAADASNPPPYDPMARFQMELAMF
jgi:hypothetical protein